jgi:sulfopyruvate decarboxylase TPP-binding subunit
MTRARLILEELEKNRVTHVVGLPDNASMRLFEILLEEQGIRLVQVTREGEAFAIAAGLWIGGRVPVVLVQNTGFFESGDGLRGTVMRMRIPLVTLITYRGYGKLRSLQFAERAAAPDAAVLSQAHLDSAALITEPTLAAWGVPFDFLHADEDVGRISEACRKAEAGQQPVALLVTQDFT